MKNLKEATRKDIDALPEVDKFVLWNEDDEPREAYDSRGIKWRVGKIRGEYVKSWVSQDG